MSFQGYRLVKKKIKTLGKISLLISSLLIHLVRNNNLLLTRPIKKTKITKKIFDTILDKIKVKAITFLQ